MISSCWRSIAFAVLLAITVDGFTIRNQRILSSNLVLGIAITTSSPPPPPAVVQGKPYTTASSANTIPQSSPSNLPSQKELAEKAASQHNAVTASSPKPAVPKSTNTSKGSGIIISDIHYDGVVPKTESDEYVVITNNSNSQLDVSGYYIYVATTGTQGPTFYFPKGTTLKANQSVRIYTNEIHKETGGYTYGSGKAIWSNNGGLAVLKDANGKKLMEYKYKPTV